MSKYKMIRSLGSTLLAASMSISGCAAKTSDTEKETLEETTTTATEETTTEDPCACDICDIDDYSFCGCCVGYEFVSTNGELEGQDEYMILVPDVSQEEWQYYYDNICGQDKVVDVALEDLDSIEDDELRAIAEAFQEEGYVIQDPDVDLKYGLGISDGEYMYTTGFQGVRCETLGPYEEDIRWVYAYKTNETLFEYFMLPYITCDLDDYTVEDDGVVIRYERCNSYAEFNRETNIGIVVIQ